MDDFWFFILPDSFLSSLPAFHIFIFWSTPYISYLLFTNCQKLRTLLKTFFAFTCSGSSLPVVNRIRLTGDGHLEPEPTSGILTSNENIMQEILNPNLLVEQLEQIQTGKPVSYPRVLKQLFSRFTSIHEMKQSWKSSMFTDDTSPL